MDNIIFAFSLPSFQRQNKIPMEWLDCVIKFNWLTSYLIFHKTYKGNNRIDIITANITVNSIQVLAQTANEFPFSFIWST